MKAEAGSALSALKFALISAFILRSEYLYGKKDSHLCSRVQATSRRLL
jgi:hypothetical protein